MLSMWIWYSETIRDTPRAFEVFFFDIEDVSIEERDGEGSVAWHGS